MSSPSSWLTDREEGSEPAMPAFSLEELKEAFDVFCRVGNECAEKDDYNAFADLFTEDCLYVEHFYGTMHGREAVRTGSCRSCGRTRSTRWSATPTIGCTTTSQTGVFCSAPVPTCPILATAVSTRRS